MPKKKSTAVAVHKPQSVLTDRQAFYAMIERAASNKDVDVSKMQALMAMKADEQTREAWQAFSQSMVECQTGMLPIRKNVKADRFKYVSFEALDDAMRPLYTRMGFSPSFSAEPMPDGRVLVVCDLYHRSGVSKRYSVPMTPSAKGAKGGDVMTQIQAEGAAVSFGRRYLLLMMFNIATSEDDRASQTVSTDKITESQRDDLIQRCADAKISKANFCTAFSIAEVGDLPAAKLTDAINRIDGHKKKYERKPADAQV